MLHLLQLAFDDPISEKELRWQETLREIEISPETLLPEMPRDARTVIISAT